MTHRIDPPVQRVQLRSPPPPVNPRLRNSQVEQLPAGNDPVLSRGEPRDQLVDSQVRMLGRIRPLNVTGAPLSGHRTDNGALVGHSRQLGANLRTRGTRSEEEVMRKRKTRLQPAGT